MNLILLFYFILNLWQTQIRTASLLSREADRASSERQTDLLCFILHRGLAQLALLTLQPVQGPPLMEVSSVSPRFPPGQFRSGMIFFAKSPTFGDKLLSNFPRGGAMDRGSFHAKVLVLFIKNGRLPLQLIKKNTVEMQEDFLRKFCSCVCYLQT